MYLIIVLIFFNLIILWYYTHVYDGIPTEVTTDVRFNDVTIVITEFEHFENNILETLHHITHLHPHINIVVLSPTYPYPYINIENKNVKLVRTNIDLSRPKKYTDPLYYIKTKYVLIIPDSTRIHKNVSISHLLSHYKNMAVENQIMVLPILRDIHQCVTFDLDLKTWSLKYFTQENIVKCDSFSNQVVLLLKTHMLHQMSEAFMSPFYESFYIQRKLMNSTFHVRNDNYFYLGKILFTSNHNKWKHEVKLKERRKYLYKVLGIKYELDTSGIESYLGCTRSTPRCFPTVLDVPSYLYEGRWTPPCCLKALRDTAKHVFNVYNRFMLRYWLEGGSLLGAARYNDIIPWDYDVDIGMYMGDIKKSTFLQKVWEGKKHIDSDGYVWERATEGDFIRVQYSETNHLHVDIFPFYEKDGMMTKDTWFDTHRQDMEFPAHYLNPLEEITFIGVYVTVPNNYKQFLELKFGKGVIENPQYPFPEKLRGNT